MLPHPVTIALAEISRGVFVSGPSWAINGLQWPPMALWPEVEIRRKVGGVVVLTKLKSLSRVFGANVPLCPSLSLIVTHCLYEMSGWVGNDSGMDWILIIGKALRFLPDLLQAWQGYRARGRIKGPKGLVGFRQLPPEPLG